MFFIVLLWVFLIIGVISSALALFGLIEGELSGAAIMLVITGAAIFLSLGVHEGLNQHQDQVLKYYESTEDFEEVDLISWSNFERDGTVLLNGDQLCEFYWSFKGDFLIVRQGRCQELGLSTALIPLSEEES